MNLSIKVWRSFTFVRPAGAGERVATLQFFRSPSGEVFCIRARSRGDSPANFSFGKLVSQASGGGGGACVGMCTGIGQLVNIALGKPVW